MKTKTLLFLLLISALIGSRVARAEHPQEKKKLIFAVDLIRHGDRTPIIAIPKAPHHWPEGLGQLTPLGMHQEYELGQKFQHRYIDQEKLLPRIYQAGTLYVRSTDVDRTLMSAECVLMGLYPPGTGPFLHPTFLMNWFALPYGFQPIPIHTAPQNHDTLLISHNSKEDIKQSIKAIPECQEKENELKTHFAAWSEATGLSIHDLLAVERLGDALRIYQLKHIAMPKGLSNTDVNTILKADEIIFKKSIATSDHSGKNLLSEISDRLEQAAEKKSALKYALYSAHDSTIMSLLNAMHVPIKEIPHYASDLNIALYEKQNHYFEVQVTLNDHPVQLKGIMSGTCSLQEFLALARAE
ncbi:MAG: histidine phosphatase family protein [Chthoniobacterales bacterium]|nr:histidine phosphatase family protein [Chthoniobacterales bacterium]